MEAVHKSKEIKKLQFEQKLQRIRMAQVMAAEEIVMQGLRDKGLIDD